MLGDLEGGVDRTDSKLSDAMRRMRKFIRQTEGMVLLSSLALMIDFWFLDRDEIWVVYNNSGYHTPGFAPGRHSCMNTDTGVDALSYMYFSFIINGFVSESILLHTQILLMASLAIDTKQSPALPGKHDVKNIVTRECTDRTIILLDDLPVHQCNEAFVNPCLV